MAKTSGFLLIYTAPPPYKGREGDVYEEGCINYFFSSFKYSYSSSHANDILVTENLSHLG